MAINGTTTISQLTALNSASLDTTLVGVDNGVTYKIELDVVADAVSDRINTLDEQRLNNLEQFTSSVSGADIIISSSIVLSGSNQTQIKRGVVYAGKGYFTNDSFDIGAIQYPKYNYGSGESYVLRANDTNINNSGSYFNFEEYITSNGSLVVQNAYSASIDDTNDPSAKFTGSIMVYEAGGHSPYVALGGSHISLSNVYGSASFNGVAQLTAGTTFVQNFFGAGGVSGSGIFQMARTGNRSIGGNSQSSYHVFGMISTGSASNLKRTLAKNGSHYTIGWFNDSLNGGTAGVERFEIIAYDEIAGTTIHPNGQISASVFYHQKYTNKIALGTNILSDSQNTISGSTTNIGNVIISGSLIVGSGSVHEDNPEILHVENSGSWNIAHFEGDNALYSQLNVKNKNSGGFSSTDIVATADNGTEDTHYVNMGINSSNYIGGYVGEENDAYLINSGGDMYIGTLGNVANIGKTYIFAQNRWRRPQIVVNEDKTISFNTTASVSPGFTYEFSGSAKFDENIYVVGSITGSIAATNGVISSSVQISNLGFITASTTVLPNGVISGSSQLTSSFDERYVLSGSITQTTWDNISGKPSGLVSQSTDLTSLNTFTASFSTASLVSRLDSIESVSSSWITESETGSFLTSLNGAISASSQITALGFISSSIPLTSLNSYTASNNTKWDTLGVLTGSYATTGSNTFKENQIVSASVYVTGDLIVFGTSSFQNVTASVVELGTNTIVLNTDSPAVRFAGISVIDSGSNAGTGSLWWDSVDNHWIYEHPSDSLAPYNSAILIAGPRNTGSLGEEIGLTTGKLTVAVGEDHISSSQITDDGRTVTIPGILSASVIAGFGNVLSFSTSVDSRLDLVELTSSILNTTFSSSVDSRLDNIEIATSSYETKGRGIVSGSSQLTSSFDNRYVLETETGSFLTSLNGAISSSSQLTSSYDLRYTLSGSVQPLPSGVISGSSQLTSSFDTRYALSGSVGGGSVPAGTISGSSQLTSSFDLRYLVTGSVTSSILQLNSFTASNGNTSLNSYTASNNTKWNTIGALTSSFATTGSNEFNGNQTITGSLTVSSVAVISSSLSANSSSLTLSSGSNLYIHNNGFIELTGSIIVSGGGITGSIRATNGVISGSSQLTASFDARYALSGSIGGGATDITSLNLYTSSNDITNTTQNSRLDQLSTFSGSNGNTSLNSYTSSNDTANNTQNSRLNNLESYTSSNDTTNNTQNSRLSNLETFSGSNGNTSLNTYTSSATIRLNNLETTSASLNTSVLNLNSFTQSTSQRLSSIENVSSSWITESETASFERTGQGIVSGSSQLTSSYDVRYILSGSIVETTSANTFDFNEEVSAGKIGFLEDSGSNYRISPQSDGIDISYQGNVFAKIDVIDGYSGSILLKNGIISGSSQLTSSFDSRYLITGSVTSSILQLNTFTSSLNIWSSSVATTGSNTFRGTETISGSLLVSGSTTFTGSISISSGSITMPNRPGVRVTGAGGAKTAVTTLSGSYLNIDWQQSNAWDNSTGTFTAPISGLYQVNVIVRTNSNSLGTISQLIVYKNNTGGTTGTPQIMIEFGANTTMNHTGGSTICKLAAGDTLKMVVAVGEISFDANDNFSVAYIG